VNAPHLIRLHQVWTHTVRIVQDEGGGAATADNDAVPQGERKSVLCRTFNAPSGITDQDRIELLVRLRQHAGQIRLNDTELGPVGSEPRSIVIGSLLRPHNRIELVVSDPATWIDLEPSSKDGKHRFPGEIALRIAPAESGPCVAPCDDGG